MSERIARNEFKAVRLQFQAGRSRSFIHRVCWTFEEYVAAQREAQRRGWTEVAADALRGTTMNDWDGAKTESAPADVCEMSDACTPPPESAESIIVTSQEPPPL